MSIVEIRDLYKEYRARGKAVKALNGIDLTIEEGEFFGLLGPNGAGKTTLIQCITTLLIPTKGEISVCGYDALREPSKVRASIGCMLTGERSIYWKLTGRENLDYFGALYHIKGRKERIEELISMLSLEDFIDRRVETYSSGQRMKVAFAKTLIADPPAIILDEPTITLDVLASRELRQTIKRVNRNGTTVIYTTHLMFEVEELCDRVAIIDEGVIKALDTVEGLKRISGEERQIKLSLSDPSTVAEALRGVASVKRVSEEDGSVVVVGDALDSILKAVLSSGVELKDIDVSSPDLENVFLRLTGKRLEE
ncbi:MAG: ABC transporter ATP-binding protein [Candidatus Thermoplasmatota archaeon]|nr:ABC transporter ATP-binding protein [Candidatus Thermoplasmatota archaeon]